MILIIATIKAGDTGPQVANLQDALLVLLERKIIRPLDGPNRPTLQDLQKLTESLKQERAQSLFGKTTAQVIVYFQVQQRLGDNLGGVVEEKTAAKLNELLKSVGAFDNPNPPSFRVHGHVVSASSKDPVAGLRVEAWDKDLIFDDLAGADVTGEQGDFHIEFTESYFKELFLDRLPDLFFKVFLGSILIKSTEDSVLWNVKAGDTEVVIEIDMVVPSQLEIFVVQGKVRDADGSPLSGVEIRAFDKDLRGEQCLGLGKYTTDKAGNYEIRYSNQQFRRAEKGTADLVVRVYGADNKQLAASPTHFNASAAEVINLTLPDDGSGPSELERYLMQLEPVLNGVPLPDLTSEDLDFLAGDTGINRDRLLWLSLAAKSALTTASGVDSRAVAQQDAVCGKPLIPLEAFYGWFRKGLPTDLGALWATSTGTLLASLNAAIDQHIIPPMSSASQESIKAQIEKLKLDLVLQAPAAGIPVSLGSLLATLPSPPTPDQQRALAGAASDLRPDDPHLVERIAKVAGFDGDAASVARTLRLGALTSGHLPLVVALQNRLDEAKESEGTLKPLAALPPDKWLDLAHTYGTPGGMEATPAVYADALSGAVERQHPHAALVAHFVDGRRLALHPALPEVGTFLTANQDFDIVAANIDGVENKAKLDGVKEPGQLIEGLRSLQRMNTLGANWDETAGLLEHDIYSPPQILDAGPTQLAATLDGRISPERTNALYSQAKNLHDVAIGAFTAGFAQLSAPQILPGNPISGETWTPEPGTLEDRLAQSLASRKKALTLAGFKVPNAREIQTVGAAEKVPANSAGSVFENQPTLQSLFGPQDSCACGHCNSVLGPAAYFVDLLQFIKNAKTGGALLATLLTRRPDLQDIELSCNNTNTEVPSIDLALEILENAVALPLDVDLQKGTTISQELPEPINSGDAVEVGDDVKKALKRTVRNLPDVVLGTREETKQGVEWTVVDGHRRWKLIAQEVAELQVSRNGEPWRKVDTSGLNLPDIIAGLDKKSVAKGAETAIAQLLAPNQVKPPGLANYDINIQPLEAGSWSVTYSFAAQLTVDEKTNQHILSSPQGAVWSSGGYNQKTIAAAKDDLAKNAVPALTQTLLAQRFPAILKLAVKPADSGAANQWVVTSIPAELKLKLQHTRITIVSLAYQSGDPDADAVAEPENHNPEAYLRLKGDGVVFPWSLPVDLPLEEVRLFLDRARCPRRRLIELLSPDDQSLSRSAVFASEVLGLSAAEASLIATARTAPEVYECWGSPAGTVSIFDAALGQTVTRGNVSFLLQQSRLSFVELQAILATQFEQGGKGMLAITPGNTCQTSEMNIPGLTAGHLDRLHRFTRLWRKLGWTVREVDLAIQSLGGELTSDTLLGLARLQLLKQQLDLPVPLLVGGLSRLEIQPWTEHLDAGPVVHVSLYSAIFQRETLRLASDFAVFSLPLPAAELIEPYAAYIGACLGVKSSVVQIWVSDEDGLGIANELNLDNLSRLTSAASLCRALRIDPEKLALYLKLYGVSISPFQPGMNVADRAEVMLQFVKRVRLVQQSGIDVETLHYVLHLPHETPPAVNVDLDEKQLADLADAARTAAHSILAPPAKAPPSAPGGPEMIAIRVAQENAAIAALATGLNAARELVDDLLRLRLQSPLSDAFFHPDDFPDIPGLVAKLQANADPVSAYLWSQFSPSDQTVLGDPHSAVLQQQTTLVSALNRILLGPSIYNAPFFANVTLSPQTLGLISLTPAGADLVRFNRLLLEDAYATPLQIAKRLLPPDVLAFFTGDPQPVKSLLVRLYKSVLLCTSLKLRRADLFLLRKSLTDSYGFMLDFNTLPAVAGDASPEALGFEQLLALSQLRRLTSNAGDLLRHYAAVNFAADSAVTEAQEVLAEGLVVDAGEVKNAAESLQITTAEQYRDPIILTRLVELLVSLKQLGATVDQVRPKAPAAPTDPNGLTAPSPSDADAGIARQLLHAKYGESQWHDLIKPISDKLRERQRDALVDYLVNRDHLRNADDLYERYLIDVQTGSCLKTTRLLQATGAVQLFVQRVLLNLEDGASLSDDQRHLWDWMHHYRVWEANRKVFLFPENWLLPELRDDKTAIFEEMEGALTQQEQTVESTRDALLGYLEELADLAQINVIAMYQEQTLLKRHAVVSVTTLYVVGRMPNQTSRYFWRSCENFGDPDHMSWSGWEALDLDNANDFIMPFVMAGDLHLAWPVFNKKVDEKDKNHLLWDVQIAWTRRTNKGWVKRKLGSVTLSNVTRLPNKDESASFVFRLTKDISTGIIVGTHPVVQETIKISCYAAAEAAGSKDSLGLDSNPPQQLLSGVNVDDGKQWNVSLQSSGAVYRYAIVGADKVTYSRPFDSPVNITLIYAHKKDGVTVQYPLQKSGSTSTSDGTFSVLLDANVDGEGVLNGSSVSAQVEVPANLGGTKTVGPITLGGGPAGGGYFKNWDWQFDIAVEDPSLKDLFKPDRPVDYQPAATFVLESGRDLRFGDTPPPLFHALEDLPPGLLGAPSQETMIDGNRFVSPDAKHTYGRVAFAYQIWDAPRPLTGQIVITVVTASAARGTEPQARYVQDKDGGFYVQRRNDGGWHYWADGQPFASAYRTEAIISTSDLFQPDVQRFLHSNPPANTFQRQNAYANYDWELFLHVPLAIADHFANQQRFEDARRWLHAVFDPTTTDRDANGVPQFWRFLEFPNGSGAILSIATLLTWLADPSQAGANNAGLLKDFGRQIDEWKHNPFMPHVIARLRPSAYQWQTFFAYLDVLIGWGDQFFRRDTRESVNDATLLYVLAAKLLGPRPRTIPPPTPPYALTYRLLAGDSDSVDAGNFNRLDQFSNAWINYADLPGIKQMASVQNGGSTSSYGGSGLGLPDGYIYSSYHGTRSLTSLTALAFCIPQNDKVTEYYDTLENRLFNVRHCRNIDGVFRDLPLYDPPIDPLLLIRARAAGLDIDSVLGTLYAPLPNYRFSFTLQKAIELSAELKALGSALLMALEKQDAEALTLLRSTNEIALLKMVRDTRQKQIDEANANIDALQKSADAILQRFGQYQKLLGKPAITKDRAGLPVVEQSSSLVVATDASGDGSGLGLIRKEVDQFNWSATANTYTMIANEVHVLEGILGIIPNIWGGDSLVAGQTFGGSNLASAAGAIGKAIEMLAADANYHASQLGILGGYERRQDEWVYQSKLALGEFTQIQQQIVAAQIRMAIAESELNNHETQIANSQEVDDFMRGKFTSQQLYSWMSSQIADVYFRTYQVALDQAQRAERAYQHELGPDAQDTRFIQSDNWDNLKRGLLAGEHLYQDLKRLECTYLERNGREFEITKHVSLLQLDPGALISLKAHYTCTFDVPEALLDLDYPGHYMRRIKMVNLSIPCVAGPYASVSATLQLTTSKTRVKSTGDTYNLPEGEPDSRFTSTSAAIMAIVTSSAQQDSGMFEPNLRDERYLPFEGAGAVSTWKLSLPEEFRPFDYDTISDVVLHIRYTARDGHETLKTACQASLQDALNALKSQGVAANGLGLRRLFSLRHEFPTEWYRFLNPPPADVDDQTLTLTLGMERFPFLLRGKTITVSAIQLFVMAKSDDFDASTLHMSLKEGALPSVPFTFTGKSFLTGKETLAPDALESALANWKLTLTAPGNELAVTAWLGDNPHGRLDSRAIHDVVLVCRYTCSD